MFRTFGWSFTAAGLFGICTRFPFHLFARTDKAEPFRRQIYKNSITVGIAIIQYLFKTFLKENGIDIDDLEVDKGGIPYYSKFNKIGFFLTQPAQDIIDALEDKGTDCMIIGSSREEWLKSLDEIREYVKGR